MKKIISVLSIMLISYFIIEIGSWIILKNNILQLQIPNFSYNNAHSNFWMELNPVYGVWHYPYSHYTHHKSCFKVDYQANSFGMRDKNRTLDSVKPRVVVLGDSLIEGFGLKEEERLTNLMEKKRQMEHLNFGTSGNFGTTQYYLLYKDLVKNFSHTELIVGIYPMNDFNDDNYEVWKSSGKYRPFLKGNYPNYELIYSSKHNRGFQKSFSKNLHENLMEFSYSYNILYSLLDVVFFHKSQLHRIIKDYSTYAGFYNYSDEDWDRMRYNLELLIHEAHGKQITFVLIPAIEDLQHYEQFGPAPLSLKMQEFSQKYQVKVVDLLPFMFSHHSKWQDYFFTCDGHWNPYANKIAAEYISNQL